MSTEKNLAVATIPQQVAFNFFDPTQFETMQRVCRMFANSELVPEMYRVSDKNSLEKAMANCMIAVEMAQRVGASPLMIMQNMVIIYGRPSWSSKFLVATVNTCGRFNPLQYRFTEKGVLGKVDYIEYEKTWVQGTNGGKGYYKTNAKTVTFDGTKVMDVECVAFTNAKGSDKMLESSPVSIRLAVQEGWYTKAGSKWKTMTKQMLMYRAASFWTNVYAPELSMGMKTEDELSDIVDVDYEDVTDKVGEEIANKANAGKPISFDDNETTTDGGGNGDSGSEQPAATTSGGNESQTPQAAGNDKGEQKKMPGF
jgi:hypothetical protein